MLDVLILKFSQQMKLLLLDEHAAESTSLDETMCLTVYPGLQ